MIDYGIAPSVIDGFSMTIDLGGVVLDVTVPNRPAFTPADISRMVVCAKFPDGTVDDNLKRHGISDALAFAAVDFTKANRDQLELLATTLGCIAFNRYCRPCIPATAQSIHANGEHIGVGVSVVSSTIMTWQVIRRTGPDPGMYTVLYDFATDRLEITKLDYHA